MSGLATAEAELQLEPAIVLGVRDPSTEPMVLRPSLLLARSCSIPKLPTNSRKVAFSVSFMTDYAATWSQPYLMKVFNTEEVALKKFLDDFNCPMIPPPNWNSVGLHAGVQLTRLHCWVGQGPTDESLLPRTEGKCPTCRGNKQHPFHLPPDNATRAI
ncbi:uncharacterized protein VP01_2759g4 [Puccinia sorghi]|uniref:Retrotransposon gag domain-containing protein n=1 Tax=Puccinia sorghi TaxID=27349 RepID=A0A0L6V4R4_9BASI|nr:uncharacterized protein VP01_2759g4 [Puccinia sorghi]